MVASSRHKYPRRKRSGEEPSRAGNLSLIRLLPWTGLPVLHQLKKAEAETVPRRDGAKHKLLEALHGLLRGYWRDGACRAGVVSSF